MRKAGDTKLSRGKHDGQGNVATLGKDGAWLKGTQALFRLLDGAAEGKGNAQIVFEGAEGKTAHELGTSNFEIGDFLRGDNAFFNAAAPHVAYVRAAFCT